MGQNGRTVRMWTSLSSVSGNVPVDETTFSASLNSVDITAEFSADTIGATASLTGLVADEYLLVASVADNLRPVCLCFDHL